ncbi:hypothetical protein L0337_40405 [candidate division KSB1 bacterium]|nr:hypothetical protein [candidate division KSB1 bacterium]
MEELISKLTIPMEAKRIIDLEIYRENRLKLNPFVHFLERRGVPFICIQDALERASTLEEFKRIIRDHPELPESVKPNIPTMLSTSILLDINSARKLLKLSEFSLSDADFIED